jgi:ferredoxin
MGGIRDGFRDADDLVREIVNNEKITSNFDVDANSDDIWLKLNNYAWDKWQLKIGFTHMPSQLIFKGKGVLFPYTIVCMQEMKKSEIDKAPALEAGQEVQRVYAELGIAVNDIANWLRKTYNIKCHANHPLGGLVNTTPLATKAGMGWQGRNGLLITPEYGQRVRIAPIFVESKLFEYTDSREHEWIENFCESCGLCERSCPSQAIFSEKVIAQTDIEGLGQTRTCIDREKCYVYFNQTLGCSVCVKVCPFSKANGIYDKLKMSYEKNLS